MNEREKLGNEKRKWKRKRKRVWKWINDKWNEYVKEKPIQLKLNVTIIWWHIMDKPKQYNATTIHIQINIDYTICTFD